MMLLSYENILKRLMRSEGPLLYICENKSSHALNPWRKITRLSRDIFQKNKIRVDFTPSNPFWFMWLSEVLFLHLFLRHQIFGRKKNAVYLAWQSALTIAPNEYIASAISNHRHPILFRNRYRNNLQRVCCNFLNNGKLDNSCFQTRKNNSRTDIYCVTFSTLSNIGLQSMGWPWWRGSRQIMLRRLIIFMCAGVDSIETERNSAWRLPREL